MADTSLFDCDYYDGWTSGENGIIPVTKKYFRNEELVQEIVFDNQKPVVEEPATKEEPDTPKTGDSEDIVSWVSLM